MPTPRSVVPPLTTQERRHGLPKNTSKVILWLGVGLVSFLASKPAIAEDAAKNRSDSSDSPAGPVHLSVLEGDLQVESFFDWRRTDSPRTDYFTRFLGTRQTDREFQLRETMGLHLVGDYLFPELLTYDIGLRFGVDQLWSKERSFLSDQSDYDNGWLTEYDVNLSFLSRKPINFDIYALRQNERISRLFLPSLNHEMQRHGGTLRWENERWPMELTFERSDDTYRGTDDFFDEEDFEETLLRYSGTLNVTPHHRLQIDSQYSDLGQQYSGSSTQFDTTRTVLNLDDRIEFGPKYQHIFETFFEYEEDQGDLPRDHLYLGPQLTLNHTDSLSTRYKYQFNREKFDVLDLRSHRFDVELTHQLGEALTTTADVFAGHESSDDGMDQNIYGGNVRSSFRKKNPLGVFSATMGYYYDQERTNYDRNFGAVRDETVFFQNPLPSYLEHQSVIDASITVTNLDRTRVFDRGRDYAVVVRGARTALVRMPTGRINDRESVLAHYRFQTAEKTTGRTHQFDARIQQDFNSGWTPYYAVNLREQDIHSQGTIFIEPNNLDRHRLGLTYTKPRWSVGGEIEVNDETIDPYDAVHLNYDRAILATYPNQLDLRAGFSRFWFRDDENREAALFDISLDYRRPINPKADLTASAAYRYEDDTIRGTTQGIDLEAGLEYRIGQLTLNCNLEYDKLDLADARDDSVSLWLKIRREFPNLLKR
jgi:hypothetical protein